MLMNKSLLFYILSMVGRQQARNERKDNISIPQITIPTSRRAKHSQHCHGLAPALPAPGCPVTNPGPTRCALESGSTGTRGASPAKIPAQSFFFTFSLLPFPCFTHSVCPSPLDKHQIAKNVAVKQGYGPKP